MLAEDEEFILEGIKNIINWEILGLEIIHMAKNGKEALEMWEEEHVDIVITDISMPCINGLQLLKELRDQDKRVRFIILTGYDEFEYARTAIRLDVENYILKPIDEEQLEEVLKDTIKKLEEIDKRKNSMLEDQARLIKFLSGKMNKEEMCIYLKELGIKDKKNYLVAANIKMELKYYNSSTVTDIILYLKNSYSGDKIQIFYYEKDEILILITCNINDRETLRAYFSSMQNKIETCFNILTFVTIAPVFNDFLELPEAYKITKKLQKYLIIEGYGNFIDEGDIEGRQTKDIIIDESKFYKLVLNKDKKGVIDYLEDLLINNAKQQKISIDAIYQLSIKIAMILQKIIEEYQLLETNEIRNFSDILEDLNAAEDIFTIKTMFIAEITEIIELLHTEDSHYTPVIKQIISEVQKNYKADMNLKTLAYKYNMNPSYLGQIFQKEVGCSFAQYLSNIKNGIARDLILNTNMKINDIAQEVGYPDTSYFYRKFKQCYGVSPASLREMKKY